MNLLKVRTYYSNLNHDGVVYLEGRRWFLGGRMTNLCFFDGQQWHQAEREVMRDPKRAHEWISEMHYRMVR